MTFCVTACVDLALGHRVAPRCVINDGNAPPFEKRFGKWIRIKWGQVLWLKATSKQHLIINSN